MSGRVLGISIGAVTAVGTFTGGGATNPLDLSEDEGPDNSDRRHNLVLNGSYVLPLDIQVSGIYSYRSALPYSVSTTSQLDTDPFTDRPEPRNSRRGSDLNNFDMRVSKIVTLPKRMRMPMKMIQGVSRVGIAPVGNVQSRARLFTRCFASLATYNAINPPSE